MSLISKIFGIFKLSFLKKNAGKVIPVVLLFLSLGAAYFLFVFKPAQDREHFVGIYKEILIIRFVVPDSAKANKEIRKVINEKGLSEKEFNTLYNYYASTPDNFLIMLDSAKARAEREILARNAKNPK